MAETVEGLHSFFNLLVAPQKAPRAPSRIPLAAFPHTVQHWGDCTGINPKATNHSTACKGHRLATLLSLPVVL